MTRPTRIPSDVNRPDRILGPFTARQVSILAATAVGLYLAWIALRDLIPLPVFLIAATPVAAIAFVIAVGQRDGLSMDRLLLAAIRHRTGPRRITHPRPPAGPTDGRVPGWISTHATTTGQAAPAQGQGRRSQVRGRSASFPARGVTSTPATGAEPTGVGVVDLGPDGLVVIAVMSTVNLALRTPAEQDGLVDSFARYLHTLTGPVQILVRALPLDLTGHLRHLHDQARELPHPALAAAAAAHRDHLARLAARRGDNELLTRQVLLVLREPRNPGGRGAEHRLLRRLHDATGLLAPLDVIVTPLNAAQTTALLADTCNPDHHGDTTADERRHHVVRRRQGREPDDRGPDRRTEYQDNDGYPDDGYEYEDDDQRGGSVDQDQYAPADDEYDVDPDGSDGDVGETTDDVYGGDPDAEAWEPDPWADRPRAEAAGRVR